MAATPKVIAVTGASRGIGSAIAGELARRGHLVACLSRKGLGPEDGTPVPGGLNLACDVDDEAERRAALGAVVARFGRLDGLVNNAGLHLERPSHECSTADFAAVMLTNVTAVFALCREAYPHLLAGGGGLIVNIGSFFDKLGVRYCAAYSASKAAVGALTRTLAVEWARKNIRLLNIAPGFVATDLNRAYMEQESFRQFLKARIPVGGPAEAEEIARFVAHAFAEDFPHWTGETLYIDGGQAISQ